MIKLKYFNIVNYCGYRKAEFDFTDKDGSPKPLSVFYGPNGIGKCVSGSSYVITDKFGQIKISELFNNFELEEDTWYDVDHKISINGKWGKVRKIYYNGKKDTIKLKTKSGYKLEGSQEQHRVLAVKDGTVKFVYISDLVQGDFVCISRKSLFPKSSSTTLREAKILGYLISEGCTHKKEFSFTNKDDDVILDYKTAYYNLFNTQPHCKKNDNQCISLTSKKKEADYFYKLGLGSVKSGDKEVPQPVLSGTKNVIVEFLKSYFEGDGGVEKSIKAVSCCSKSEKLMHQIHLMLLRLGIISSLRSKNSELNYTDKYPDGYTSWRIIIQGDDIVKFARQIGFISSRKKDELDDLLLNISLSKSNPNKDVVPVELVRSIVPYLKTKISELPSIRKRGSYFSRKDYKNTSNGLHCLQDNYLNAVKLGVSKDKIESCCNTVDGVLDCNMLSISGKELSWLQEDYFFDIVESVDNGYNDLFDVHVEGDHCYWGNGFINHNSSLISGITMAGEAFRYAGRPMDVVFRKFVFNKDYDPIASQYKFEMVHKSDEQSWTSQSERMELLTETEKDGMKVEAIFDQDGEEKEVVFTDKALLKNGLERRSGNYCYYIDADNPMNMTRFQVNEQHMDRFIELTKIVYGFDVELKSPVKAMTKRGEEEIFMTDAVIDKYGVSVHFKSMSAGEKKIATLIAGLCDPNYIDDTNIIIVDNVAMHIYFKRHVRMVEKLLELFDDKQFFLTTHSGVLIDALDSSSLYDLEDYVKYNKDYAGD